MKTNAAVAAINYSLGLDRDDCPNFLNMWNEGSFQEIKDNYDNVPEEVFIGADPLHPETNLDDGLCIGELVNADGWYVCINDEVISQLEEGTKVYL